MTAFSVVSKLFIRQSTYLPGQDGVPQPSLARPSSNALPSPQRHPGATPDYEAALASLLEHRPDILVVYGGEALATHVLAPLEDPTTFSEAALRLVGSSAELRHRFFGLSGAANTSANARLVMHYNELYKDKISRTFSPNADYDAFYMIAYAVLSLGRRAGVDGAGIAKAFGRLQPPGKPVDVGPTGIFEAFSALERGENVDLNGATGSLDFDVATGEAPVDQVLLCVGVDADGKAAEGIASGVTYSAATKKLEGKLKCP